MDTRKIIEKLVATGYWGEQEAKMGIESNFKCQYCGKDLLESVDNYKEWQADHLIPQSLNGGNEVENLVLSCRTCNFIKSSWNPASVFEDKSPTRTDLIKAATDYINSKRALNLEQLIQFRKIVGYK